MWTTAKHWRGSRLRRTLLITSAEGKGRDGSGWDRVGEGSASGGGDGGTAGKIVIAGWTGEPFVAPKTPTKTCEPHPAAARRWSPEVRGCAEGQREGRGEGRSLLNR
jgi:hypothetical protein